MSGKTNKTTNKNSSNNNRKFTNKRKSNGKNRGRDAAAYEDSDPNRTKSSNDPAWYAADPALLRDSASIPFSWSVGTRLEMYRNGAAKPFVVPGICSLRVKPIFGQSATQSDPVNVAATSIYSFIRHANSGHANYDAPDMMVYIMAMSQIYSYINFLQRAYGVAMLYAQQNRYLPDALLRSMGFNPSDVQTHLAQFRYSINLLINKASSLAVPSGFTLFNRQAFLYQNIYCEGTSIKDQLYLYNPVGFWFYSIIDNSSGLMFVPFGVSCEPGQAIKSGIYADEVSEWTVDDAITYGNNMLQRILESEDLNIMSGDILKAYGDAGIMKLVPIAPDFSLVPMFDIGVLEQMKNAFVAPVAVTNAAADKYGDVSLSWYPKYGTTSTRSATLHLYSYISQDPTKARLQGVPSWVFNVNGIDSITKAAGLNIVGNDAALIQINNALIKMYVNRNSILTTTTSDVTPELTIESSRLLQTNDDVLTSAYDETWRSQDMKPLWTGTEVVERVVLYRWKYTLNEITKSYDRVLTWQDYGTMMISTDTKRDFAKYKMNRELAAYHSTFHFAPAIDMLYMTEVLNDDGSVKERVIEWNGTLWNFDNYAVLTPDVVGRMHEAALLNQLHVASIARVN